MTTKQIEAYISETGQSSFSVSITVSGFEILGDEPFEKGGKNLGPAPYDLLLAALGECTVMTVRWYALQQNWPLERVDAKLTHRKENFRDVFTKHLTIFGDELTEEQKQKLVEIAAKCPIQRTLEGSPLIETKC